MLGPPGVKPAWNKVSSGTAEAAPLPFLLERRSSAARDGASPVSTGIFPQPVKPCRFQKLPRTVWETILRVARRQFFAKLATALLSFHHRGCQI